MHTSRWIAAPLALAFILLSSGALLAEARLVALPDWVVPMPGTGGEVPVAASLFIGSSGENQIEQVVDPDGLAIEWDIQPTEFSDQVRTARPVDGWKLGAHRFGWDEDGTSDPAWTVVDVVDDVAPEFEILSWQGQSATPSPPGCGGCGSAASVRVELSAIDEPVVLAWELIGEDADLDTSGVFFGAPIWANLTSKQGATVEVYIDAYDLSGNSASASTVEATACAGCSGSVASGGATSLGGLLLAGLLSLRRWRPTLR